MVSKNEHFQKIHEQLKKSTFGNFNMLPPFLVDSIFFQLSNSHDAVNRMRNDRIFKIKKLAKALEPVRNKWLKLMKPHIRQNSGHIHLPLLYQLHKMCGSPDEYIVPMMLHGVPTTGTIPPSFNWHKTKQTVDLSKEYDKLKNNKKVRTKAPEWMRPVDIKRLWNESAKLRNSGRIRELSDKEIKFTPTYGFGVNQGEFHEVDGEQIYHKLRAVFDFRPVNVASQCEEKLKLMSHKELSFIIAIFANSDIPHATPRRNRKDANADMFLRNTCLIASRSSVILRSNSRSSLKSIVRTSKSLSTTNHSNTSLR